MTLLTIVDVRDQIRARLSPRSDSNPFGNEILRLQALPYLDLFGATNRKKADSGFVVEIKSSLNADDYRPRDVARIEDTVVVRIATAVKPNEQLDSEAEALLLEEQARKILTEDWPSSSPLRLTWRSTTRGIHRPGSGEWYLTAQTFTVARDGVLGGQNA